MNRTHRTPAHTIRHVTATAAGALAAAVAIAALAAPAGASTTPAAHIARAQTQKIQLRHTSLGNVIVDSSGFTLYRFSKDSGKQNTCLKTSECSTTWPALETSGQPTVGPGLKASLVSTISLPGGKRQVTYAGHPLYRYAAGTERGETSYAGVKQFGGTWYAVSASGGNVK
jgi:predicted lipoprotein with Yx(FWY)xxD motif